MARRLADQALDLLHQAGFVEKPLGITLPGGYWRTQDVYRWEVWGRWPGQPSDQHYGCWQTLTDFVRLAKKHGIGHSEYQMGLSDNEIFANEPPLTT